MQADYLIILIEIGMMSSVVSNGLSKLGQLLPLGNLQQLVPF